MPLSSYREHTPERYTFGTHCSNCGGNPRPRCDPPLSNFSDGYLDNSFIYCSSCNSTRCGWHFTLGGMLTKSVELGCPQAIGNSDGL